MPPNMASHTTAKGYLCVLVSAGERLMLNLLTLALIHTWHLDYLCCWLLSIVVFSLMQQ